MRQLSFKSVMLALVAIVFLLGISLIMCSSFAKQDASLGKTEPIASVMLEVKE